ncbi:hypothetical protein [Kiloniella litopenaei]|uniref:hypothetical protein n=1 Tax=Kiloniella litopenaei TaxID=1549748 RepID=UPI003BAAF6E5
MRNVPDKRVSSTARFDHPEENSITVRRDVADLSDIAALQETEKKIAPEKFDRKAYQRENTYDLGLLNDFKSERDSVTEYLYNILLEVNLYDRISEVTPEIYQRINHLISSENLSPSGVSEVLKQEYDGIKVELSTRHKNGSPEQEYQFEEKLDQKISADKLYVESLKQGAYQKTAFDTIDRLANKYGQGVTLSPETLTDAMIAVEDTVNKLAPGIGRDGAITKIKETRGLLFSNALQGYGDQKNYNAIQSLLDGIDPVTNARLNSGDYITAEERDYYQNLAGKGLRREAAHQLLDDVEAQVISTDELLGALQNHPDNSLGQEALSLWQDRKRTEKKENRDRIKKQRYTVWQNITETNGNIDITDLPLDLSDEDRDLFFSYLNNQEDLNTGVYDPKSQGAKVPDVLLYEIKKLQIANPDIFADRDLSGYFKNLSPKQIAQVIAMQENGLDPKDVANFKMREREALRIWKQVTGRNGYDEPDRQDFINFSIRFSEEINDFITFEERPANAADINQIANRMIENGEVVLPAGIDEFHSAGDAVLAKDIKLNAQDASLSKDELSTTFVGDNSNNINTQTDPNGHFLEMVRNYKEWMGGNETPILNRDTTIGLDKYREDDVNIAKKMMGKLPDQLEKSEFFTVKDFIDKNYKGYSKEDQSRILILAYSKVRSIQDKNKSTNFTGVNKLELNEVKKIIQKEIDKNRLPELDPYDHYDKLIIRYYKNTSYKEQLMNAVSFSWNDTAAIVFLHRSLSTIKDMEQLHSDLQRETEMLKFLEKKGQGLIKDEDSIYFQHENQKQYITKEKNNIEAAIAGASDKFIELLSRASEYKKMAENGRRHPIVKALAEGKGKMTAKQAAELMMKDPVGVLIQLYLEDIVQNTSVRIGKVVGTGFGGKIGGRLVGAGVRAYFEQGKVLMEQLEDHDVDLDSPQAVREFMEEHGDSVWSKADRRALASFAVDVFSESLDTKITNPVSRVMDRKVSRAIVKRAEDTVGDVSSEALRQVGSEGRVYNSPELVRKAFEGVRPF